MPRRNIKGFIDPISIIGVLMLVITLVVGTKVVNDKGFSLNIVEQAAGTKKQEILHMINVEKKVVERGVMRN